MGFLIFEESKYDFNDQQTYIPVLGTPISVV